ncbi:30S ribosomal protein S6 [Candidatus Vidania fulgoroideorum]
MKMYEVVFICNKSFVTDFFSIINKIKKKFKKKIIKIIDLGIRKLCHKINNQTRANYYLIFSERNKKIIEYIIKKVKYKIFILRTLVLKINKHNFLEKIIE